MPLDDRTVEVHAVDPQRWPDLEELFERPGPRGGRQDTANCWCSVWRTTMRSPEENKATLCQLVTDGRRPGLLAYRGDEPAGWVSVAPREDFPSLLRSQQFKPHDTDEGVWVITCFHVDRRHRGAGIAGTMLEAAIAHATRSGATAIEAYPADPPDYKGRLEWFLAAGFAPVREAGKRTVVRRDA
jgi:GNAT superfamily N-acetyltransferase